MSLSQYLLGAAELAVIVAALGLGAYHLRAWIVPGWSGAPARLAELIVVISMLVIVSELFGVVGLFNDAFLIIGSVVAGLGTAAVARGQVAIDERERGRWASRAAARGAGPAEEVADPSAPSRTPMAMFAIAAAAALLVVAHWGVPTAESLDVGMYYQDTTWYHMSFSGRFAQGGEIGPLHFTDPLRLAAWFYPQNSELLHAVGIEALDDDALSPLYNIGWLVLGLLAAWCIGRPFGVGAGTLLGAALVFDSDMILGSQAGNAPNDALGLFFLLAVVAFLVTGAVASGRLRPIAGGAPDEGAGGGGDRVAGGGDAVGGGSREGGSPQIGERARERAGEPPPERDLPPTATRESAAASVTPAGAPAALAGVGTGALLLAGLAAGLGLGTKITLGPAVGVLTVGVFVLAGRGARLRATGIWLAGVAATAGFWFARNVVLALNPLPWLDKLGPIDLPGPDQLPLYPREPHRLSEYANDPKLWDDFFTPVLRDRLGDLWPVILALVAAGLILALVKGGSGLIRLLALTGIVAGLAYFVTPLTASGSEEPTGFDANLRYVAPAVIIGLVLLPIVPALRRDPWRWVIVAGFGALLVFGSVTSPQWHIEHWIGATTFAIAFVLVPLVLALLATNRARIATAVGLVIAVAAVIVLGRHEETDYLRDRYSVLVAPPLEHGFRASPAWRPLQEWGKETSDSRIAVFGRGAAFGQYIFYGDDLSNHVQYVGLELDKGTYRPIANCRLWRQAVNRGDYDYVVTTPALGVPEDRVPLENEWTDLGPGATQIVASGPAAVYAVSGPLDPAACLKLPVPDRGI